MEGKILNFEADRQVGTISGDDGRRYKFMASEFKGAPGRLRVGGRVDFDTDPEGVVAIEIFPALTGSSEDKNKWIAAILAIVLGVWGIHKFYLGKNNAGIIMLLCGTIGWILVLPGIAMCIVAFIEFIIYLVKSEDEFHEQYVAGDRAWF